MFLKDCNGTFQVFVWTKCLRLMKMDYWAEHANNKWLFGHKWWTLWNKSVIYYSNWDAWECLHMMIIKCKWIFMVLFLTSVDSKMADISLAGLGFERRSQIMLFPWSLKKKSGTAVALTCLRYWFPIGDQPSHVQLKRWRMECKNILKNI